MKKYLALTHKKDFCFNIYSACLPITWICYQSITTEIFSPGMNSNNKSQISNPCPLPGYRKKAWVVKDMLNIPNAALMCFIVYMIRDWRLLQFTIAFMGICSLVTWFFTHESGMMGNHCFILVYEFGIQRALLLRKG